MLEIHSLASSACRIYPCKGATWAVTLLYVQSHEIFACGVIEKYADRTRLRGGVMAEGKRADLFGAFVTAMEDDFLATLASSFLDKSPLCLAYFGLDRRCRFANPNYRLTFGI